MQIITGTYKEVIDDIQETCNNIQEQDKCSECPLKKLDKCLANVSLLEITENIWEEFLSLAN